MLGVNAKGGFQGFEVFVVLPQRVLEFESAVVELLRPLRLLLAAENPTCVIFGFYDKYPENRNIDMVDLRRAAA